MARLLKKKTYIFPAPKTSINEIILFPECANMVTSREIADAITSEILQLVGADSIIIDATANMGGNAISFAKAFKFVICFEINKMYATALKSNLEQYGFNNTVVNNCDFTTIRNFNIRPSAIFIDPPWYIGDKPNTRMELSGIPLVDVVDNISPLCNAYIIVKLPPNVDPEIIKRISPIKTLEYRKMIVLIRAPINTKEDTPVTGSAIKTTNISRSTPRSWVAPQLIPAISREAPLIKLSRPARPLIKLSGKF